MTAAMEQHTVLPPEHPGPDLEALTRLLAPQQGRAKLVAPDGAEVELPDVVYRILRQVVTAMSNGLAITVAPHTMLLTTQQAADLLNISRPTLVRLLTDEVIPFETRGRHRRVRLVDVVEYQEQARVTRRATLDRMTQDAEAEGRYDSGDDFIHTR
ncbi:helix-turn-helix domain-containing protein [Actinokineospora sp. NBRC 105648]|uniref:helix-turn-helix domain-containing protein n=1 Tax=Actinokineospora sp. NBRC 105648 TaxID=3032206 RepID=UPI0024A585B5|nr:helix-turn-helix domain-containing protein [Actinokineospora sp. NBRC 105648]GLZ42480.1 hypothetical protein Acsp05_61040 [Actinokineospora sp. NBRC 105648]